MTEDDLLQDLNRKVDNMQQDINDIQGDVNIISTLNKELNRSELIDLIEAKFGGSDYRRLIWYHADGNKTTGDFSDILDASKSTVRNYLSELNSSGLIIKRGDGRPVRYDKAEITQGLGLKSEIEDELDP